MRIDNKVWAAVFLVSILFTVLHGRIKGKDSEHWTPVTGVITHSSVNYAWRQDSPTHGRMEYVLDIRYRYQAGGKSFEGNRYRYGYGDSETSSSRWGLENTRLKYPVGQEVTVYFNPDNPGEAVLLRGTPGSVAR